MHHEISPYSVHPESRWRSALSLLEVCIAIVILFIIVGQMLWTFRWASHSLKVSQQRTLAYAVAVGELEKRFSIATWPPVNSASTRASSDPTDPLYNYFVQFNAIPPLWDSSDPDLCINLPNAGYSGEFDATYSASSQSVFMKVTVTWTDYRGSPQQVSVGSVKARY